MVVFPLDGGAPAGTPQLPATRLHLVEGRLGATPGYTVSSLTSTNHHLKPNPLTKHEGATYFSGEPAPAPPRKIVVGAEAPARPVVEPSLVVGSTGRAAPTAPAAPSRAGIVIGLSNNSGARAAPARPAPRPAPQPAARRGIVIGSSRRRRQLLLLNF